MVLVGYDKYSLWEVYGSDVFKSGVCISFLKMNHDMCLRQTVSQCLARFTFTWLPIKLMDQTNNEITSKVSEAINVLFLINF